ncbi:MAG: histidinol dehydrogenase [Coriobacteriia bacterium]
MMRRIELGAGETLAPEDLERDAAVDAEVLQAARAIIDDVRARGDEALFDLTERYDGVRLSELRVSDEEFEKALAQVDEDFLDALAIAAGSIEEFHRKGMPRSWFDVREGGVFVGQKVSPLRRVGIYVPGGRACYPSTVLMNAIPALVAGVDEIAMTVPPASDGTVSPYTLAAARAAGVTEVYKVGGAQAVAALAYGTESIARVDKVTGPGNAYVTAAKKLVVGDVGIDMLAGPSEVLVLADGSAPPEFVAADLMAQAEHDPKAAVYLVTTDPSLPDRVEEELEALLEDAPRADIIRESIERNGLVVVCDDVETALDAANTVAPEHLEVMMVEPFELLGSLRCAGAVFLGPWTPESVGDYVAGPNHTLPTGGTARFYSPLSCDDFVTKSSVISYSREALELDADAVIALAEAEGLAAHAEAVRVRMSGAFDLEGEIVEFDAASTDDEDVEPRLDEDPADWGEEDG